MATTLATLVSDLRNELKIDPNDKVWSQSLKEDYINEAYLQIQRDGEFNWRENQEELSTFPITGGTEKYDLPSDFIRLDFIQLTDSITNLRSIDLATVRTRGTDGQSEPSEYFIYGNEIGFYPIPDTSYNILMLYRKRLPTLTDSQDSQLPADFDQAIVKYASYLAWSAPRGNEGVAQSKLQDYEASVRRLRLAYIMQDSYNLKFGYQRSTVQNRSDKALYYDT